MESWKGKSRPGGTNYPGQELQKKKDTPALLGVGASSAVGFKGRGGKGQLLEAIGLGGAAGVSGVISITSGSNSMTGTEPACSRISAPIRVW